MLHDINTLVDGDIGVEAADVQGNRDGIRVLGPSLFSFSKSLNMSGVSCCCSSKEAALQDDWNEYQQNEKHFQRWYQRFHKFPPLPLYSVYALSTVPVGWTVDNEHRTELVIKCFFKVGKIIIIYSHLTDKLF